MNKILIGLSTILLAGGIAVAQNNCNDNCKPGCTGNTPECNPAVCTPCNCTPGQCTAPSPFDGLNLTAEQQSKIDALKAQCKEQQRQCKEQSKADKQEARSQKAEKKANARAEMLGKVKEILTPEQYVQFLENAFVQQGNRPGKPGKAQGLTQGQAGKKLGQQGHKGMKKSHAKMERTMQQGQQAQQSALQQLTEE